MTQLAQGDARSAFPQLVQRHRGVHAREFRAALLEGSQALQWGRGRCLCVIAGQTSRPKQNLRNPYNLVLASQVWSK